jgi:hypothetical protein
MIHRSPRAGKRMIKVSPPDFKSYTSRCIFGISCAFCLALIVWVQPFFFDRFIASVDLPTHIRWSTQFHAALQEGVWHPRWAFAAHGGLGDPTFLYYQPLFYYLTSFFIFVGYSPERGFVLAALLPSLLAGSIVFCQMARICSFSRAMLGMAMVVTCPALFFISTHYGAFPWVMSTPFCILFAWESTRDRPDPIRIGMWLACISLSHLLSGLMILMCTGGARLIFSFPSRRTLAGHFKWIVGVIWGICLTAYFILPALTQQNLINPSAWTDDPMLDWHRSFAFPTFTYWRFGIRWFSLQWPLPIFALLMCVLVLVICRRKAGLEGSNTTEPIANRLAIMALVGLVCSSEFAYPLFAILPPLQKLQWPYRFVVLSVVLSTLAFAIVATPKPSGRKTRNWVQYGCAGAILMHLCFSLFLQRSLFSAGKPLPNFGNLMQAESGQPEYLVAQRGNDWKSYNTEGKLPGECHRLEVRCDVTLRETHSSTLRIISSHDVTIRLPVFAFSGWRLDVDGRQQQIVADPKTGLITVEISPGTHEVRTLWGGTPAERPGNLISITAFAWLIACLLIRFLNKNGALGFFSSRATVE